MRRFTVVPALLLLFSMIGIALAPPASAAGGPALVSTSPADNSSIQNPLTPPAGPVVSATYDANMDPTSTIVVKDNTGSPLDGTTSLSGDKRTISFTPSADLTDAGSPYQVDVVAKRETLVALTTESQFDFSIDNTAPAKPSIASVEGDTTAPAAGNDTTPTIVVTGVVAGETVKIFDGGTEKGSKAVPAASTSVTFNAADVDTEVALVGTGAHSLTATATDAAGNVSPVSTAFQYDLDTTSPAAPTISSVEGDATTPASGKDTTPTIVVTGVTAGDSVRIVDGSTEKAVKTASGNTVTFNEVESGTGSAEVTVSGDGNHSLTAKSADPLGNVSSASPAFVYALDSTAPTAPAINSVEGDTATPAAGADTTPIVVVGSVVAGDTVRVYDGDVEKASKVVPVSATSVTFNPIETDVELTLSGSGNHALTAKSEDPAGNLSAASAVFTYSLDTTGAAPQVVSTHPVNGNAGAAPSTASATYTEALNTGVSTLVLKNKNNNNVAGAVTFSGDGKTIIFTPNAAFNEAGSPYTATASVTDLEGNAAEPTVWTFTVDTSPPSAPVIASVDDDDTSPATGRDTTPSILVTGVTAGDTVKVFDSATEKASKVVPAGQTEVLFNGGTDADATLTGNGSHSLTAKALDGLGNTSNASAAFVYNLDTTAPGTPTINSVEGDTSTPASGADATPTVVVGNVTAGDTVKVFDGAAEIASKVVPASATTVTFNNAEGDSELTVIGDGNHVLKAKAIDAAENVSSDSLTFTYTLDSAGPDLVSTSPANGSTVQPPATVSATYSEALAGTSTISVTKTGGAAVAGAKSFGSDGKTIIFTPSAALTQADSPYAVTVVANDTKGTTTNSAFNFAVDTTPPAAPSITSVEGDTTTPATANDATPTVVVGGVVAGDTVKVFDGATEKGSKVVPGGATSVTFNATESDSELSLSGAGDHTLTAKASDPAGNTSAASAGFVYTLPVMPTITSVDPTAAPRNTSGVMVLNGTNFTQDSVVSFSGGGITVDDTNTISSTEMEVAITISEAAALGARDLTVSIPGQGSGTCVGCFTILPAQGYTMVGADGGVFNFGTSVGKGSPAGTPLNAPIIGIAHTPSGQGYWLVAEDGGIFSYGDAAFWGSMGGKPINAPVLGMEPTPTGNGYWLFAADGGIFSFGDAAFHGSMGGQLINAPVVGMAATSTGSGYWLVAQDGGIFSFKAPFHGSTGGMPLAEPVFDMAASPDNSGYWLVARDGGIFAFDVPFFGSAAEFDPFTVVGMGSTSSGNGYWIADEAGLVYNFGDAVFLGDLEDVAINAPIVGFAVVPGAAG
jgi:large repetitive protein